MWISPVRVKAVRGGQNPLVVDQSAPAEVLLLEQNLKLIICITIETTDRQ